MLLKAPVTSRLQAVGIVLVVTIFTVFVVLMVLSPDSFNIFKPLKIRTATPASQASPLVSLRSVTDSLSASKEKMYITPQDEVDQIYSLMGKTVEVLDESMIDYFVIAGTLLGAVRHSGMIPWDDDVDLMITETIAVL